MEIDFFLVRERVMSGEIVIEYTTSEEQISDIITKYLGIQHFQELKIKLSILPIT